MSLWKLLLVYNLLQNEKIKNKIMQKLVPGQLPPMKISPTLILTLTLTLSRGNCSNTVKTVFLEGWKYN